MYLVGGSRAGYVTATCPDELSHRAIPLLLLPGRYILYSI